MKRSPRWKARVQDFLGRYVFGVLILDLWKSLHRAWLKLYRRHRRKYGRLDQEIIDNYLSGDYPKKLHIGCGSRPLNGWLNSNFYPRSLKILHLDATQTFPFKDHSFDYIFSEHMIEHITYPQGEAMLKECFRVLKPGGKIRLSTPDFQFLVDLYQAELSPHQSAYKKWMIEWMNSRSPNEAPFEGGVFIINNFMKDWGHQFIYDEKTLRFALQQAGFSEISGRPLNESPDEVFNKLENHLRYPPGFLALETITLEGTKEK